MGGKGSGGPRVGAGRKPKNQQVGDITGSRRTRARADRKNQTSQNQIASEQPSAGALTAAPLSTQIPQPPGNLTLDELAEWNDLAPLAFAKRTMTHSEALALMDLCQARVLKNRLLRDVDRMGTVVAGAGGQVAANPLIARYTTLLQRVDAGMLRFGLAPAGKELAPPAEKPTDPFSEFDGAALSAPSSPDTVN